MKLKTGLLFCCLLEAVLGARGATLTVCDEASLRAAIQQGGTIYFGCDGVITLSQTLIVTNSVTLDATGRDVTLSGNGQVRIMKVETLPLQMDAGITNVAVLKNLKLVGGRALGTTNSTAERDGKGGALWIGIATVHLLDCLFESNSAVGLSIDGWALAGAGLGGAIFSEGSRMAITNCRFQGNLASVVSLK